MRRSCHLSKMFHNMWSYETILPLIQNVSQSFKIIIFILLDHNVFRMITYKDEYHTNMVSFNQSHNALYLGTEYLNLLLPLLRMLMLKCKHHSSNINYPSALERLGMDRGVNPNSTIYNIRVSLYRSNTLKGISNRAFHQLI